MPTLLSRVALILVYNFTGEKANKKRVGIIVFLAVRKIIY